MRSSLSFDRICFLPVRSRWFRTSRALSCPIWNKRSSLFIQSFFGAEHVIIFAAASRPFYRSFLPAYLSSRQQGDKNPLLCLCKKLFKSLCHGSETKSGRDRPFSQILNFSLLSALIFVAFSGRIWNSYLSGFLNQTILSMRLFLLSDFPLSSGIQIHRFRDDHTINFNVFITTIISGQTTLKLTCWK